MISPLIHRFFARSGEPMVLNNSFNENEPIVCTIGQAQPAHGSERSCTARTDLWTPAIRDQAEEELSQLVPHESWVGWLDRHIWPWLPGSISPPSSSYAAMALLEESEPGVWIVRTATVIPDNERWLHEPAAAASLQAAMAWSASHPPADADLDEILTRLGGDKA